MLRRPQRGFPVRRWGRFFAYVAQLCALATEPPRRSKLRRPRYRLRRAYVHGGRDTIDPRLRLADTLGGFDHVLGPYFARL